METSVLTHSALSAYHSVFVWGAHYTPPRGSHQGYHMSNTNCHHATHIPEHVCSGCKGGLRWKDKQKKVQVQQSRIQRIQQSRSMNSLVRYRSTGAATPPHHNITFHTPSLRGTLALGIEWFRRGKVLIVLCAGSLYNNTVCGAAKRSCHPCRRSWSNQ